MRTHWRRLQNGEVIEHGDLLMTGCSDSGFDMNFTIKELINYRLQYSLPSFHLALGLVGEKIEDSLPAIWRLVENDIEPTAIPNDRGRKIDMEL